MKLLYTINCLYFFFNDTATTEIYTLSLHDALPISETLPTSQSSVWISTKASTSRASSSFRSASTKLSATSLDISQLLDRKSTRLNSSHANISYAVFCLKKKKH